MPNRNGYTLKMEINGKPCMRELDTPADFYALKVQVENELDKLEKHGVIKKSKRSCLANPTVVTKG